jgi:uncharacterized membrane protein
MASTERARDGSDHVIEPALARTEPALRSEGLAETGPAVRLDSLDQLRGLVIVLMALDHVRDFFHAAVYRGENPLDVDHTSVVLYLTRWATHLCAPTFMFLAGVGAYWRGHRPGAASARPATAALSWFLVTRGLWLIVLELTWIQTLGWCMAFEPGRFNLQVMWALGASMVLLGGLVWLAHRWVAAIGLAIVALHNATDGWTAASPDALGPVWHVLHARGPLEELLPLHVNISYPLLPWLGVMALGYAFGPIAMAPAEVRRGWLLRLGLAALAAFAVLRGGNLYGNPTAWLRHADWLRSLGAMFDVQKYPPALSYDLATLGVALLLWRWFDRGAPRALRWLSVFGSVPMFVYLLHLPLIHLLAAAFHQVFRGDGGWLIGARYMANGHGAVGARVAHAPGWPDAPGFSLVVVYAVWIGVIALLYPAARWFADLRRRHRTWWWLSYL